MNCRKTADWIWIPFGVVSGIGRGMGVLDGVCIPQGEGDGLSFFAYWFEWRFKVYFKQTCILLVREKLMIFTYRQYISGNVVYSSFIRCTLLRDRSWHLQEIC